MPGRTPQLPDPKSPRPQRGLRRIRLWEKKHGTHTTGSSRWGGAGETLIYAGVFLIGVIALAELVVLRVVWQNHSFLTSNWGLWLCVPMLAALIVTAAAGAINSVIRAGTSAERRAALAKRATSSDLLADVQPTPKDLPAVPKDTNWKNSPGVRLAFRLPIATSPAWQLVAFSCFCLIWNAGVAVLAVLALNQQDNGTGGLASVFTLERWTLFRLVVIFYAVVGFYSLWLLFKNLVVATAIGPTGIEVSAQPFHPGLQYRVLTSQAGHLKIQWLELRLVCDEEVSYSDGTDTRSESRRIVDELVFRQENFRIVPSEPFQHECPLDMPEDAMHSFLSAHNAVVWKLVVRADTQKWSTFERVFPLVLYPAVPETPTS